MINGTYLSREALEKLIEMGIEILHLDSILEAVGDLIVAYSRMLKIQ
jgi:hypothetical protein